MNFDLKGKLGPLPVWAWGVIVGLVLVAGVFIYSRRSSSDDGTPSIQGTAIDPQGYQTAGISGGSASSSDPTPDTTTPDYESNASWLNKASADVADFLGGSPSAIYAALRKYLTGETVTSAERKYIDAALTRTGNPPEGTYGVSDTVDPKPVTPKPTPKPKPKPIKSLGYALVDPGGGGQKGVFEIYDDGSQRWISAAEWGVILGRGQTVNRTLTKVELDSQFPKGRSNDPA